MDAYLEFGMAFVDEDVDSLELCDVAVALKLLPHLGADGRDGHVQGVHGLDLGCLKSCASRQPGTPVFHIRQVAFSISFSFAALESQGVRTARSQSRYDLSTRCDASSQFAAKRGMSAQWPRTLIVGVFVHWRVRCARYVGLIMVAVCLACPPMPPVSRAMKHSRCAALLDEPTLRAGRSVVVSNRRWRGKRSRLAVRRHMREVKAQLFAIRPDFQLLLSCRLASTHGQPHTRQTHHQPCLPSAHPATASRRQRVSTTSKTRSSSSPTR